MLLVSISHTKKSGSAEAKYLSHHPTDRELSRQGSSPKAHVLFNGSPDRYSLQLLPTLFPMTSKLFLKLWSYLISGGGGGNRKDHLNTWAVFSFYYITQTNFLIYYTDWLLNPICHITTIQKLFGNNIKLILKCQIAAITEDDQNKVLNVFK